MVAQATATARDDDDNDRVDDFTSLHMGQCALTIRIACGSDTHEW